MEINWNLQCILCASEFERLYHGYSLIGDKNKAQECLYWSEVWENLGKNI
jgi:hypothetical protein